MIIICRHLLQTCLLFVEIDGERLGNAAIENISQSIPQDPK